MVVRGWVETALHRRADGLQATMHGSPNSYPHPLHASTHVDRLYLD